MDAPRDRSGEVHAAYRAADGEVGIGYVCLSPELTPVAVGGWSVTASGRAEAARKAAVAGVHQFVATCGADAVRLSAEPPDRLSAADHATAVGAALGVDVVSVDGDVPVTTLAGGLAGCGLQSAVRGRFVTPAPVENPVRVYVDGSKRGANGGVATVGHGAVDDTGRILSLGARRLGGNTTHIDAEFRAVASGVRSVRGLDGVSGLRVVTDNRRVADTLGRGESAQAPRDASVREARDAIEGVRGAVVGDCSITLTNRRFNRLADALASCAHGAEFAVRVPAAESERKG